MEQRMGLEKLAQVSYLEPSEAKFYIKNDNFLCLDYKGETYENIKLHRALPYMFPDDFISVQDMESKEIYLIHSLYEFSEEQAALIAANLKKRYFSPVIKSLYSIKQKMGYLYFDVETTAGKKLFALRDVTHNIRKIDDGARIVIVDVDGNRYLIEDVARMAPRDFKKLEPYLL